MQHAHEKGVIHRDLKPSNIPITVHDGQAAPKLLDFGVAKAMQQELTDKAVFTQFHHFIGTPAQRSPEQAELTNVDIDTRSDINSLGELLHEFQTGQPGWCAGVRKVVSNVTALNTSFEMRKAATAARAKPTLGRRRSSGMHREQQDLRSGCRPGLAPTSVTSHFWLMMVRSSSVARRWARTRVGSNR